MTQGFEDAAGEIVARDGQRLALESLVTENYDAVFTGERRKLGRLPKPPDGTVLSARDAAELFAEHFGVIHASLLRYAGMLSPFGWQWYLRRLPDVVFGYGAELSTTAPYDRILAEIISAHSDRAFDDDPKRIVDGRIHYVLDHDTVRLVLRFCARVSLLSDIERQYRRAAKGVRFSSGPFYLTPLPGQEVDRAIVAFDLRREREAGDMIAGTRILRIIRDGARVEQEKLIVLCAARLPSVGPVMESPESALMPGVSFEGATFAPVFAGVDHLLSLVRDTSASRAVPNEPGLAELLALLSQFSFEAAVQQRHHILHSLQRTGYVLRDMRALEEAYSGELATHWRSEIAAALHVEFPERCVDLVAALSQLKGSVSPLTYGPVIREAGDGRIAVDVAMATQCLLSGWTGEARREQAFKNAVAGSFEALVNDLIGRAGKAPSGRLNDLVSRNLRFRGQVVTDLDAIAEVDGEVLLVSCKSVAATAEIRAGLHRQVENAGGRLAAAVGDWQAKLRLLEVNPVGDNYDLSGLSFKGVVVTPTLQWAELGPAHSVAAVRSDGRTLAWVSSAGELERFLVG